MGDTEMQTEARNKRGRGDDEDSPSSPSRQPQPSSPEDTADLKRRVNDAYFSLNNAAKEYLALRTENNKKLKLSNDGNSILEPIRTSISDIPENIDNDALGKLLKSIEDLTHELTSLLNEERTRGAKADIVQGINQSFRKNGGYTCVDQSAVCKRANGRFEAIRAIASGDQGADLTAYIPIIWPSEVRPGIKCFMRGSNVTTAWTIPDDVNVDSFDLVDMNYILLTEGYTPHQSKSI